MDEFKEQIQTHMKQIETMEDFISLTMRRKEIEEDVPSISEEVERVRKLMLTAYQKLNDELESMELEHEQLMRRMRQQQTIIMDHVLKQKKHKYQTERDLEEAQRKVLSSACMTLSATKKLKSGSALKLLPDAVTQLKLNNGNALGPITPKMSVSSYKESPLVQRTRLNPMSLNFLDFDVELTLKLFNTIPKYMRGRETLDELNNFLQTVIVPCFNDKYLLLHRQRTAVRSCNDLELWKLYNGQAAYAPGKYFITPGDISRKINKMLDKKLQNRITMLRHVGILQEQRVSQTVCYIWIVTPK